MPKWTDEDKQLERKARNIRQAFVSPVDWSDDVDPMADLGRLIGDIVQGGAGFKPNRRMYFYCGLHGQQGIDAVIIGGLRLECGCELVNIDNKWEFSTLEERKDV